MGTITKGMTGTAFLYTNEESISVGIGCIVSDFAESGVTPYALLDAFKNHPSIKPLLVGSECKEYAAHLIPEGGYKAMPQLVGDGWIVVGDAGQFVNAVHREGSNLAMTTGRIAAETVVRLTRRRDEMSKANLLEYERKLGESFVMKDLKKYKGIPALLHNNKQNFFGLYPRLISQAMQTWFRVDGIDKISKEKEIIRSFRTSRTVFGLVGDAFKLVRAWR
jgi:electron transfer flavoprotein-quinone oxidoreductase